MTFVCMCVVMSCLTRFAIRPDLDGGCVLWHQVLHAYAFRCTGRHPGVAQHLQEAVCYGIRCCMHCVALHRHTHIRVWLKIKQEGYTCVSTYQGSILAPGFLSHGHLRAASAINRLKSRCGKKPTACQMCLMLCSDECFTCWRHCVCLLSGTGVVQCGLLKLSSQAGMDHVY